MCAMYVELLRIFVKVNKFNLCFVRNRKYSFTAGTVIDDDKIL